LFLSIFSSMYKMIENMMKLTLLHIPRYKIYNSIDLHCYIPYLQFPNPIQYSENTSRALNYKGHSNSYITDLLSPPDFNLTQPLFD
jgi:hypothetical protein